MSSTQGRTGNTKRQAPAQAAEIVREYGPFPGADNIHGVTHDGHRVWAATGPKLTLSKPRVLWEGHYLHGVNSSCGPAGATSSNYDVTSDGEHFVMIDDKTQDVTARQINVVLGWAEELKRAAPVKR